MYKNISRAAGTAWVRTRRHQHQGVLGSRSAFASSLCLCAGYAFAQAVASVGL